MSNFWRRLLGRSDRRGEPVRRNPEPGDPSVPRHVAIIMDGNGRWAKQRGLPRIAGHHSGMQAVKRIVAAADNVGVKVLTLYAFSTENWKRPADEVDFLMKLPQEFFPIMMDELVEKNVQVRMMGIREGLPEHTLRTIDAAIERTRANTGMILNFALNYGSRMEMVEAMKELGRRIQAGELKPEDIDEQMFSSCLYTYDLPDPDLMIRTSGEIRLSNFMLWQVAYSEFWFTERYWPEFSEELFHEAIAQYQRRARRYGGV